MIYPEILSFDDACKKSETYNKAWLCQKPKRILLWNWFTQAYSTDFWYTTLFKAITDIREDERLKKIFDKYGTSNFEEILTHLKSFEFFWWVYDLDTSEATNDYHKIQDALAKAILAVHPESSAVIPEFNKQHCLWILKNFDDIFTVNYDLLLYWTILCDENPAFWDYFNRDDDTPDEYCEYFQDWSKSKGKPYIFFLHGALHLFIKSWTTIKKVWGNTIPLIPQIKAEMEKWYYPLVVAEWTSENKKMMMKSNPYLKHAFDKLWIVWGQIFTFGFSFSEPDSHIIKKITHNTWLRYLVIWIRGDFIKVSNQRIYDIAQIMIEERKNIIWSSKEKEWYWNLVIDFYDTESIDIWWLKSDNIPF